MKKKAFTLIEFLVVIALIGLISTFILVSLRSAKAKARDGKRLREIGQIAKALQLYWVDYTYYPENTCPCTAGDWEASDKSPDEFMEYLTSYISEVPLDPINTRAGGSGPFGPRPDDYFYAYQSFDSADYCLCDESSPSCVNIDRPFVIIGIRNLETYVLPDLPEEHMPLPAEIRIPRAICGDPGPERVCTTEEYEDLGICRDWSQELDYSMMLIE